MFLTTRWLVYKAASKIAGSVLLESGFAMMGKPQTFWRFVLETFLAWKWDKALPQGG